MATTKRAATKTDPTTPTTEAGGAVEMPIWERVDQSPGGRTLDYRQIAASAVEIADQDGLDAVSMRRLASELGVATMALYRYVGSKEDVLWLMVDAVVVPTETEGDTGQSTSVATVSTVAPVAPVAAPGDWKAVVRRYAEDQRRALLKHPWLFEVGTRVAIQLTPNRMALTEQALASLDGLGIDADTQFAIVSMVSAYVWGSAGAEMTVSRLMRRQGWSTYDDLRHALGSHMRWLLGTGRYPHFQTWAVTATRKDDTRWRFALGLDCIIDGVATRLAI
jgi:AcrR family transcriptional regulator